MSRFIPIFISYISDTDLRKEPAEKNTIKLCDNITGYKFHNVTKYYENDIAFLSHESNHVNIIPAELLERIEGLIIYFDSEDVSQRPLPPKIASFRNLLNKLNTRHLSRFQLAERLLA